MIWDGTSWSAATPYVYKIGGFPTGLTMLSDGPRIFIGGLFTHIGGIHAKNFAVRTQGSAAWTPYPAGGGMDDPWPGTEGILTMTTFDAGGGAGPELIGAGKFVNIGTGVFNNIARWNGSTWLPLGSGTNGKIDALETWNDGSGTALYAAGEFSQAGGVACSGIAKWDGTSWSPLGLGVNNGPALSLLRLEPPFVPTPWLIVAGAFTAAGGAPAQKIAAWNGASWAPLNNLSAATVGAIDALALYDDGSGLKLYAGGQSGIVGGASSDGLQRWDGFNWSTVPGWTGAAATVVKALTVFDDGNGPALYFGTRQVNSPARFGKITRSGITSSSVTNSSGTNSAGTASVNTLTPFDDGDGPGLVVGGQFNAIDGVAFASVVRLRGGAVSPLGWGLFGFGPLVAGTYGGGVGVNSGYVHDDGSGPALFLGGLFDFAGSVASDRFAKYQAAAPMLTIGQPCAGMPATIHCANLQSGREYLNVFSLEVSGGFPGSGPWLGLYASDPAMLMAQAAFPVGTLPFHYMAAGTSMNFGPYPVPSGLAVEAITIDMTGYSLRQVSPVASIVFQ